MDILERKEYLKKYRKENAARIKKQQHDWYLDNKPTLTRWASLYREEHAKELKVYRKKYNALRNKSDPIYKLKNTLRSRIRDVLRGMVKASKTKDLLGCSMEELKVHLEKQFKPGMTWKNHGKWHIDHIKPCDSFNLSDPIEQRKCFNYLNLQPLWAKENLQKGKSEGFQY